MYLKDIDNGQASLSLYPEECALLAEACVGAADACIAPGRQADVFLLDTFASLFKALAVAIEAQNELLPPQKAVLDATKQILGLQ